MMSVERWPAADWTPLEMCLSKSLLRLGCCVDLDDLGPWAAKLRHPWVKAPRGPWSAVLAIFIIIITDVVVIVLIIIVVVTNVFISADIIIIITISISID